MAKSEARPLSTVEAVLIAAFAYLVLLITLTGARIGRQGEPPAPSTLAVVRVADTRPAPAALRLRAATCVGPRTGPYANAAAPGVTEPLAFGPPVGPLSAAAVNGVLIQRLCGGPATPGGPYRGPDRRLFAAIDAAVNGTDPNRPLTRAQWAGGVDRLVTRDGLFVDARVVTRSVPRGAATFGMRVRAGADPLVIRTRLARPDTSRYLQLPVRTAKGGVVTLSLRLRCGFQPVL